MFFHFNFFKLHIVSFYKNNPVVAMFPSIEAKNCVVAWTPFIGYLLRENKFNIRKQDSNGNQLVLVTISIACCSISI